MDLHGETPLWDDISTDTREHLADVCEDETRELCDEGESLPAKSWDCMVTALRTRHLLEETNAARMWEMRLTNTAPFADLDIMPPQRLKVLTIGVDQSAPISCLIAAVAGRLMSGVWKVPVKFRDIAHEDPRHLLETGHIQMIFDADDATDESTTSNQPQNAVFRDYGDLGQAEQKYLSITVPKTPQYLEKLGDATKQFGNLGRFWTDLLSEELQSVLEKRDCDMGPWAPPNENGTGVWCWEARQDVPVIMAPGPVSVEEPASELMAFIKSMKLPYGILFVKPDKFERRVFLESNVGRPGISLVKMPSLAYFKSRKHVRYIVMPAKQQSLCGSLGSWSDPGTWSCDFIPQRMNTLARLDLPWAVDAFVERFELTDRDMQELLHVYSHRFDETGDHIKAIGDAVDSWTDKHALKWQAWFRTAKVIDLSSGRIVVVGAALIMILAALHLETHAPRSAGNPDIVDRSVPPDYFRECLAGVFDTVNILLRSVGIAAVLCVSDDLKPYRGILIKHVLLGHFAGQLGTVLFSNYETPLCSPTLEILPLMKLVETYLLKRLIGQSSESVILSLMTFSSMISIVSGCVMYCVGRANVSRILKYMPYAAEIAVQAAIGIVLVDLGVEASCDMGVLEISSIATITEFGEKVWLWVPAIVSSAGIFLFTHYVYDSHYTLLIWMILSIVFFHAVRVIMGVSCSLAASEGFLAPVSEGGSLLTYYSMLYNGFTSIYWRTVLDNLPLIGVSLMVIVVINCACQLAIAPSILPPKMNGKSTFDHEMVAQGKSHLLSGILFGFPSDYGNDDCLVHRMFGGSYRIGVWVHIGTLGLVLAWGTIAEVTLPYIPKFINATIILLTAIEFVLASLVHSKHDLATTEYNIVVIAAVVVVLTGGQMQAGLAVALLLGAFDFVSKYATVALARMPRLKSIKGHNVARAELSGYLFFGNVSPVVDELLAWRPDGKSNQACAIVVDWGHVTGMDTKACHEFHRLAMECGQTFLVYCRLPECVKAPLQHGEAIAPAEQTEASGSFRGVEATDSVMNSEVEMAEMSTKSYLDAGADDGTTETSGKKGQGIRIYVNQMNGQPLTTAVMLPCNSIGDLCTAAEKLLPGEQCKIVVNGDFLSNALTISDAGLVEGSEVVAAVTARPNQGNVESTSTEHDHGGHAPSRWPVLCEDMAEGIVTAEKLLGEVPEEPIDVGPVQINYSAAQRMGGVGRVAKTKARKSMQLPSMPLMPRQLSENIGDAPATDVPKTEKV